jgi:RNA polymerase sigma-70 factor (ECF subfamily)
MRDGAMAGLQELNRLSSDGRLRTYYPYHAARADALARLARHDEAAEALGQALALGAAEPVQRLLTRRRERMRSLAANAPRA